jgi:prepilin-type processing-associated H-X9-DG protein
MVHRPAALRAAPQAQDTSIKAGPRTPGHAAAVRAFCNYQCYTLATQSESHLNYISVLFLDGHDADALTGNTTD